MPEISRPEEQVNIALLDANHYVRYAIQSLMQELGTQRGMRVSVSNYHFLDEALQQKALESKAIDLLFFAGPESGVTYDCLEYVKETREKYPETLICMCAKQPNSLFFASNQIDAWFSLNEPLSVWRESIIKMIGTRDYKHKKRKPSLSLTENEWQVLREIRAGCSLKSIANNHKMSYRQVSALKNSATRKLGLRNKAELLVFLTR